MHTSGSHLAAVAAVGDVLGQEYRVVVPWPERLELLQEAEELRGYLAELQFGVYLGDRGQHLFGDLFPDELVDAFDELFQVRFLEGEAGSIDMPAEILKEVCAAFDGFVQVESGHAPGGTGDESVGFCEHDGRLVESLHEAGGDDSDHTLVPGRVIYYRGGLCRKGGTLMDHLESFLGYFPVDALALVVVVVDLFSDDVR